MKYKLAVFFSLTCLYSSAQDLNLAQITSFINQPVQSVSDSLSAKGWIKNEELSGIQNNQMYQTFSYGNLASDKAQALAWFRIHADNEIVNQLYYQINGADPYKKILEEVKLVSTEKKDIQSIDNKQISTYYQNQDYTFQTITGGESYTLMIMTNKP